MTALQDWLVRRDDGDLDEEAAEAVGKSPDSALIGGLVAGLFSAAMLVLIFYVLWRTRKRPSLAPQPEKIVPIRNPSRASTRSDNPIVDLTEDSVREKDDASGPSRATSTPRSRSLRLEPSLSRTPPV